MRVTDRYAALNRRARHDYLITSSAGPSCTAPRSSPPGGVHRRAHADAVGRAFLVNANILNARPRRFQHRRGARVAAPKGDWPGAVARGRRRSPLALYFNERGRAKVELGLARGKRKADRRQAERDRDWQRNKARLLRSRDL